MFWGIHKGNPKTRTNSRFCPFVVCVETLGGREIVARRRGSPWGLLRRCQAIVRPLSSSSKVETSSTDGCSAVDDGCCYESRSIPRPR